MRSVTALSHVQTLTQTNLWTTVGYASPFIELFDMNIPRNTKVTGPERVLSDGSIPSKFIENGTNNRQYRDAIETSAKIIRNFSQADPNAKPRMDSMG